MNLSDLVNMQMIVGMFIIIRTIVRLIAKRVNRSVISIVSAGTTLLCIGYASQ